MTGAPFLARRERFALVPSTNDVVRGWLAEGTPEVVLAVADEQSAGRGRAGRSWEGPAGRAVLASLGFRPTWLEPGRAWRLAALVSLAMADAAEEVAGLPDDSIRLKWPNDLVILGPMASRSSGSDLGEREAAPPGGWPFRKLGGVLGETEGLGGDDPRVAVGIGVNGDWPADAFPAGLADEMTSLREASGGRPIDHALLIDAFLARLEPRVVALRDGRFDGAGWLARQLTNGRLVRLDRPDGSSEVVRAVGVDPSSGALLVEDPSGERGERPVLTGEIRHLRLAGLPEPDATERPGVASAGTGV